MPGTERRRRLIWTAAALALAACAPPRQADAPRPDRLRDAPPSALVPTELFQAPKERAAGVGAELAAETKELAARAEALRARGAALSGLGTLDPEARARLEAARP